MQKREDKEGSRIEKRICESVSNHYPGPTDYILSLTSMIPAV